MDIAVIFGQLAAAVPPVTPDDDEARKWAERELSTPRYAEAEPTLLDRIAQAIGDAIGRLFSSSMPGGWGPWAAVIAAVVAIVVIVAAFLIWGRPRISRRSPVPTSLLFGESEQRSAAHLRQDAASRAAKGDWDDAIVLRFRALARGLVERGAVDLPPGATVHAFARAAARAFPAFATDLEAAAAAFDDVRYLRRPGTAQLYRRIEAVDEAIAAARPASADLVGTPA